MVNTRAWSGSRAHNRIDGAEAVWARCTASAVPHAPAPRIATVSIIAYGVEKSECRVTQRVASRPGCEASHSEARDSTQEVRRAPSEDTTKQTGRAAALR